MRSPAYLWTVFGTIALLAVVTVVFTIFADPYRMFGTPNFGRIFSAKNPREMQFGLRLAF